MKDFFKSVLASALGTTVAGLALGFLMIVVLVGLVSSAGRNHATSGIVLKPKTMLVIGNGLTINDTPAFGTPGISTLLMGSSGPELDLLRALEAIQLASTDRQIAGIVISGELVAGHVQKAELRRAVQEFKKSGKPVVAWAENCSQGEYYFGSVANQFYLHPSGELEFKGLSSYGEYFGESLRLLGIGVQVTKVGKYKSAVEPYLSDRMSPPAREQEEQLLGSLWRRVLSDVATSRNLTPKALEDIAQSAGVFEAATALKLKLVDAVLQRDEFIERMRKAGAGADESGTSFRQVSLGRYADKVVFPAGQDRVAVVYAEGEIVDGWGNPEEVGGDRLAQALRLIRGEENFKAVVLRVNSPGGSAFASDVVAREVELLRKKGIPVVVSMGDVAASGGYYIAAKGSYLMADPATITGSIGVFGLHLNYEELAKKVHLGTDGVKTGRYADLLTSHRAASPDELAIVQKMVDSVYEAFLKIVADGRQLKRAEVNEIAQGRVWIGSDAKGIRLIDGFGGLQDAIAKAKDLAKITRAEVTQIPALHAGRETLLQKLLSDGQEDSPLFAKASRDPALQFIRDNSRLWRMLRTLNDPKGVYLTCPLTLRKQ